MGYANGNFSDFERQKQKGSTVTDYNAVDENDEVHRVMMEGESDWGFGHVTKNSNEKQSNQVVIETERKHLVEF